MDFPEALRVVLNGGLVARQIWEGISMGVMVPPGELGILPFLALRSDNGPLMAWAPSNQEMFANDWVKVTIDEVVGHG